MELFGVAEAFCMNSATVTYTVLPGECELKKFLAALTAFDPADDPDRDLLSPFPHAIVDELVEFTAMRLKERPSPDLTHIPDEVPLVLCKLPVRIPENDGCFHFSRRFHSRLESNRGAICPLIHAVLPPVVGYIWVPETPGSHDTARVI